MQEEIASSAGQTIECKVCSKLMKMITNTHLKKHNLTCEEYKIKYPGCVLGDFSKFDMWRRSEENKINLRKMTDRVYSSPELMEKRMKNHSIAAQKPEYKKLLSDIMKVYSKTPEAAFRLKNKPVTARMKLSNFQRWVETYGEDEAIKRQLDWQSKNILPNKSKDTKCELTVAHMLSLNGIIFIKQFHVPRFYCDFYLPDYNLIIEVDGDYWHANPSKYSANDFIGPKKLFAHQIWARDLYKKQKLEELGYQVMSIWESDLKNKSAQQLFEDIVRHCEKLQ